MGPLREGSYFPECLEKVRKIDLGQLHRSIRREKFGYYDASLQSCQVRQPRVLDRDELGFHERLQPRACEQLHRLHSGDPLVFPHEHLGRGKIYRICEPNFQQARCGAKNVTSGPLSDAVHGQAPGDTF